MWQFWQGPFAAPTGTLESKVPLRRSTFRQRMNPPLLHAALLRTIKGCLMTLDELLTRSRSSHRAAVRDLAEVDETIGERRAELAATRASASTDPDLRQLRRDRIAAAERVDVAAEAVAGLEALAREDALMHQLASVKFAERTDEWRAEARHFNVLLEATTDAAERAALLTERLRAALLTY